MADAISIEEANKIRAAIGLKPLPVPGGGSGPAFKDSKDEDSSSEEEQASTLESRQAQGYDNWKTLQDEQDAKAKREAKNEAIKKARDAARKFAQLEGKGLGEADDTTELDTKTWLLQQKKRQKKLEREKLRKMEKELQEREQAAEHTAGDLAGVRVAHEVADFDAGEQILTLKDAGIDENEEEGDELENLELKEREVLEDRLNLKKKKPLYDPHAEDEAGGSTILKHYDDNEGKKRKRFTLDGQGSTAEAREDMRRSVGQKLKAQAISLDFVKDVPTSDYKEESEAKIKKPKKKKAKSTRQRPVDEDDIFPSGAPNGSATNGDGMDLDFNRAESAYLKPIKDTSTFMDDDDLQANLAIQRKEALKKRTRTRPEDLARQMREEAAEASNRMDEDDEVDEGALVIDETTEFVANLRNSPEPEKLRAKDAPKASDGIKQESPTAEDNPDIDMDSDLDESRLKRSSSTPLTPSLNPTGLDEEANINQGVGATLALLTQRGLIQKPKDASTDLNALHRDRHRFLADKRSREAEAERKARLQRERDRTSGKLDRLSARDREEHARWENKQRDQAESRLMADIFAKEYKPNVQLKYVDEFGRSMNQKEAFKHLSHQFHGKGSGKQKTEKHLKRIEDGKRREAMSSLDSSEVRGMNSAMGAAARKNRQAGVQLG
ncbi:MAG: hypothetical protein LQ352_005419 [Teloschistes flavicans]|nr:MAG: hypothetical protein LQ352_005419 [Teloschistes flavicans]